MTRHRVKNVDVDVDDELDDDYDGDDVDEAQMEKSLAKTREILGEGFTDAEIRDSLWYYYYDWEKAADYLLSMTTTKRDCMASRSNIRVEQRTEAKPKATTTKEKQTKGRRTFSFISRIAFLGSFL